MDHIDYDVAQKFAEFNERNDPALVYSAMEIIQNADWNSQASDSDARKRAFSHWLHFFEALDGLLDPTWDTTRLPVGVAPPQSNGIVYSSGEVDPSTIADPVARAKYEQAL